MAGILWSKQFFFFDGENWLDEHQSNPLHRGYRQTRNWEWFHKLNRDVISMPDKWEYPWVEEHPEYFVRGSEQVPGFTFMAGVYWDLEWTLQQQGFDYCYDKRLYDRLRDGHAGPVREHFWAGLDYQDKLARFLENHDEPRAAATFAPDRHQAAAVITFLSPGLRFFHQGQFEGRLIRISPHLGCGPNEIANEHLTDFYDRLLAVLRTSSVRDGQWQLLECQPGWEGNGTYNNFVAFAWEHSAPDRLVVIANYASSQGQCRLKWPWADLAGRD